MRWNDIVTKPAPKPTLSTKEVIAHLRAAGSEKHKVSAARLGIPSDKSFGVPVPDVRKLGKQIGRNQELAEELWESGYHEARLLAALVAVPEKMTGPRVDGWLGDVVSWDLCDHLCNNLLIDVPFAARRIPAWAKDDREFVRRAAFALMSSLSIHRTEMAKEMVEQNLKLIHDHAHDPRNYVKKAVSWALREIGKRDRDYGALDQAIALAVELSESKNAAERWVGKDALKELETLVTVSGRRRLVSAKTKSGGEAARKKK